MPTTPKKGTRRQTPKQTASIAALPATEREEKLIKNKTHKTQLQYYASLAAKIAKETLYIIIISTVMLYLYSKGSLYFLKTAIRRALIARQIRMIRQTEDLPVEGLRWFGWVRSKVEVLLMQSMTTADKTIDDVVDMLFIGPTSTEQYVKQRIKKAVHDAVLEVDVYKQRTWKDELQSFYDT